MTPSESLQVSIGGDIWWGGFTADLAITNTSDQTLEDWAINFTSQHQLDPQAWGVALESEPLKNGLTRYSLTGADWGRSIPAGGTINVGFNGKQGSDLGRNGNLTEAMLVSKADLDSSTSTESNPASAMGEMVNEAAEMAGHDSHNHSMHQHVAMEGPYTDINSWGSFHGSNHNSEHNELVGGRTAITTEAMEAYNGLRAFAGLEAVGMEAVGKSPFADCFNTNSFKSGESTQAVVGLHGFCRYCCASADQFVVLGIVVGAVEASPAVDVRVSPC